MMLFWSFVPAMLLAGVLFAQQSSQPPSTPTSQNRDAGHPDSPPARQSATPAPAPPSPGQAEDPHATVLFERSEPAPDDIPDQTPAGNASPPALKTRDATGAAQPRSMAQAAHAAASGPIATDAERMALTFTAYDLDVRLVPAETSIAVRAKITVRNDGAQPLTRLPLQISSSLAWLSVLAANQKLYFTQQMIDSDLDHTGEMSEALVILPAPLAPAASLTLDALYSGAIAANAERLERIGAPHDQAIASDWDRIAPEFTGLRGFGNVLWYPVASPALALGDGARLFEGIGAWKLRQSQAAISMRVQVEYRGAPPTSAVLDGKVIPPAGAAGKSTGSNAPSTRTAQVLDASAINTAKEASDGGKTGDATTAGYVSSAPASGAASGPGAASQGKATSDGAIVVAVADQDSNATPTPGDAETDLSVPRTATFTLRQEKLGFRAPSLFVISGNVEQKGDLRVWVRNQDAGNTQVYFTGAALVRPLYQEWFGPREPDQTSLLNLIDLPEETDQPFDAGGSLFLPLHPTQPSQLTPMFSSSLMPAWFASPRVWMSEGLAQFMSLLWTERTAGRAIAYQQLEGERSALALAEPETPGEDVGQSLDAARDPIYYRTKAAYVWWMLREIAGEKPLQTALRQYRAEQDTKPDYFEHLLETASGKDLRWFFDDWVYRDRGLPDLSIAAVIPRRVEATEDYLVAVEVANAGYPAAEVPVTLHSGPATVTQRLLVAGRSSATTRILVQGTPDSVTVNDGTVPESGSTTHRKEIEIAEPPRSSPAR